MSVNWVKGFRRIGWVLTFPITALLALSFFEATEKFTPAGYEVEQADPRFKGSEIPWDHNEHELGVVRLGWGDAFFRPEVPQKVANEIINDFAPKAKLMVKVYLDEKGNPMKPHWTIIVHKQQSVFRWVLLISASFVFVTLVIQGSISLLAWIMRGFKATGHIDAS